MKLEPEKRDRIINSAINEFAKYPYNSASTNNIVKNAGISKGLLFHYFGSKRELYEYLSKFVIKKLFNEVNETLNWEQSDIFERLKEIAMAKLRLSQTYPLLFEFVISMFKEQGGPADFNAVVEIYQKQGINIKELFAKFYSYNIDYSLFKDQKNIGAMVDIIRWTIEKFGEEKSLVLIKEEESIDFTKMIAMMDEYIDVLRKAFY
ncbi:MAG: TetR/AcrR family transcriptional regulator [Clostridia bacterium]|nr:TetR/AcrR family transcriptional regulator [Clostridia bacterium]